MLDIFSPDIIKSWNSLGLFGGLAFIILAQIIAWIIALQLIGNKIIPLVSNHLEHIQASFDRLAGSYEENTSLLQAMKNVHEAQVQTMELHNDMTRELLKQLKRKK